jgi:hypothetical protein
VGSHNSLRLRPTKYLGSVSRSEFRYVYIVSQLISTGGSYVQTGVKVYDVASFLYNVQQMPMNIAQMLVCQAAKSASPIVLMACGKLALKTSYIVLSGTKKGWSFFSNS